MAKFIVTRDVTYMESVEIEAGSKTEAARLANSAPAHPSIKRITKGATRWTALRRAD